MSQSAQSSRSVVLVAVSGGKVYTAASGNTVWFPAYNPSALTLASSGVVRSASAFQKLYFADGSHSVYYDPADNTLKAWAATAGTLPADSDNNTPRLICTWRGRVVVSGLLQDPQNWFMSAVGDPTNWDYFPFPQLATQAVAGNNSTLGLVGDAITALVPFSDDTLILGGDHTLWVLQGDPMAGGQIQRVSDAIGMAWGAPWCKDPYQSVYFLSNRCGLYQWNLGQSPVRISQPIEQEFLDLDTGSILCRMEWDDRYQGLHVFLTDSSAAASASHYFWEQRSGAWWKDTFTDTSANPLASCVMDGNLPADRHALIGSWNGYVRQFSPTATDDDGENIDSAVVFGPLLTPGMDEVLLKDLQAHLGSTSGNVTYSVYAGSTAEIALASSPVITGTWSAGRNPLSPVRRSAQALWVKITSSSAWTLEQIRARVAPQGQVRRRATHT